MSNPFATQPPFETPRKPQIDRIMADAAAKAAYAERLGRPATNLGAAALNLHFGWTKPTEADRAAAARDEEDYHARLHGHLNRAGANKVRRDTVVNRVADYLKQTLSGLRERFSRQPDVVVQTPSVLTLEEMWHRASPGEPTAQATDLPRWPDPIPVQSFTLDDALDHYHHEAVKGSIQGLN